MRNRKNRERGAATIFEAAFVFPITFFIVFFMIMIGEGYYQQARVEYAVTSAAINGAARVENPMLGTVIKSGVPTDPTAVDVLPYRYIFTGDGKAIGKEVQQETGSAIRKYEALFFKGMKPEGVKLKSDDVQINPLISSFPVSCSFRVPFPIKMIFFDDEISIKYTINMTASIGDPAEFVRIVAYVKDLLERSETATKVGSEVLSALSKLGQYIN